MVNCWHDPVIFYAKMGKRVYKKLEIWISMVGLIVLGAVFTLWLVNSNRSLIGVISALLMALLFAMVCLRFVPEWMRFWSKDLTNLSMWEIRPKNLQIKPKYIELKVFSCLLFVNLFVVLLVYVIWLVEGNTGTFLEYLNFWKCTDSSHYLDIARDWYLSEGEWDRLVQLVFLPGYPLTVRLLNYVVGNYLYSAMLVSALSFAGAGCVLYRLLRLDYSHSRAIRTLKYLCILPAAFFFTAPMSESLFLLLCASCIYCARTKKWLFGCLLAGLASFTRSLGVTLFVPLLFELISTYIKSRDGMSKKERTCFLWRRLSTLMLIPAGFLVYCYINYLVSGNPLKFMEYQSEHWGQNLSLFFNTAAYQMEMAIKSYGTDNHDLLGLWLPNLFACFSSLVAMFLSAKKMRPSYTAWFIAYFVTAIGATWLLSAPRYLIALFPVPLAVSLVPKSTKTDLILSLSCLIIAFLYLCAFVLRWQVW